MAVFLILALVLSGLNLCSGQESPLTVAFNMSGINGTAAFTQQDGKLTVAIKLSDSLGPGPSTVEIRPIWVDYDVTDKCSTTQLGAAMPGFSTVVNFLNNASVATFPNVESVLSLEGSSIVVMGSSKNVCASIESEVSHLTAVAQFQNLIQGNVYFRQSNNNHTRIVSDLFSGKSYNGSWLISDSASNCSLMANVSMKKEFNPKNVLESNCSSASPESCAVGQLSGKLGDVSVGANKNDKRLAYVDKNLPSIHDINGKLLLIKTPAGSYACADIKEYNQRQAIVEFNNDGITGSIHFSQPTPFDFTTTNVNLKGLNALAKGYHVHLWPTPTKIVSGQDLCGATIVSGHFDPYGKNASSPNYPAPDATTDDMYELGDLSFKYGTLANQPSFTKTGLIDWNLPLFGHNSIIGRSLVIHRNDMNSSRWVCANIQLTVADSQLQQSMAAVAIFKYPVIGHITFIQAENQFETSIFAQLDYNDGRTGTKNHTWQINTNMTMRTDMTSCPSDSIYNPQNMPDPQNIPENQYADYCKMNSPLGCKVGDMSGKLGTLSIRNAASADTSSKQFFTDMNLPLSGPYSVIGRTVVIMNDQGTGILACATIQPLQYPMLQATINSGHITGTVTFSQNHGFGARKTMVTSSVIGLNSNHRFWIYELAPAEYDKNNCTNLGGVFNPLNITATAALVSTDDKYMVGDLSRFSFTQAFENYNLPLTGLTSIRQRSLVMVDNNTALACAKIISYGPPNTMQYVEAVSTFTGNYVNGIIHMFQTVYADGSMSDTSILVDLKNKNGQQSFHHNWHTHINPIQGDANVEQSRCNSAGDHFDPYMAYILNQTNYMTECKPENPLRCEVGDQAAKLSTYNVGGGPKMFTDVDLPLAGKYSVQGRSMVLHIAEKGAARLACADIIPVTSDYISLKVKSSTSLDRRNVSQVYAHAINANPTDIVIELVIELKGVSEINVHFFGFQRDLLRSRFREIVFGKDTNSLNPYAPVSVGEASKFKSSTTPYSADADYLMLSTTLLLTVLAVQILNNL